MTNSWTRMLYSRGGVGAVVVSAVSMTPSFAVTGPTWGSVSQKMQGIKATFKSDEAKANVRETQVIYKQLDEMRKPNERKFFEELKHQPPRTQTFICSYVKDRHLPSAVPSLLSIFESECEKSDTDAAAEFLGPAIVNDVSELAPEGHRKFFIDASKNQTNMWTREAAIHALGRLPADKATIDDLRSIALSGDTDQVRADAAQELAHFAKSEAANNALAEVLAQEAHAKKPAEQTVIAICNYWSKDKVKENIPALIAIYKAANSEQTPALKSKIVRTVRQLSGSTHSDLFKEAAADKNAMVRDAGGESLK